MYDNLAFSARLSRDRDADEIDDRVEEVAEFLALVHVLEHKPYELDDSQRQRVAIGRSLVRDALGYLFDEPFTAQDVRVRSHVRSVTTQWQTDRDRTSIFTTSDAHEALTLADQVAVMHQGFVHQVGSPRDLYDQPADLFVAGFLGSPAMNLIPATVSGNSCRCRSPPCCSTTHSGNASASASMVIVGIRPELCHDATTPEGHAVVDRVEFTTRIDDVEWRGKTQLVYLGYELEPDVEETLSDIEDALDFDLFGNFIVAELPASSELRAGMSGPHRRAARRHPRLRRADRREPDPRLMAATVSSRAIRWVAAAWAVLCGAAYTTLALVRFERFEPTSYDNAIFEQAIRGYAHLQAPIVPIKGPDFNLLGDHFSPIIALVAPCTGCSPPHRRCWWPRRC